MTLPAHVQSHGSAIFPKDMIVQGSQKFIENKVIVVVRVVANTLLEQMCVLNPLEQEVQLFKETIVGFGQPIQEFKGGEVQPIVKIITNFHKTVLIMNLHCYQNITNHNFNLPVYYDYLHFTTVRSSFIH